MSDALDVGTLSGRIELVDSVTNIADLVADRIGKLRDQFLEAGAGVAQSAAGFFTAEAALGAIKEAGQLATRSKRLRSRARTQPTWKTRSTG